ncbi:MAG: hypothetical protein NPIRA06_26840 [Nitrospirales bacterium]|nr:MAG: hypothetical protein NPIRA06_26840 [Nitrospirales bacterium]
MNSLINIKELVGLALTLSLAGGGLVMLLHVLDTASPMKTVTVHEILRDQNPGQISYISFPINEHLQNQLASHRKSIPLPGERYSSQ